MSRIKTCVSLYSLQDEYMNKRMSLEDIFEFMHNNDVEGIEFLPDQMIHGTPHPTDETVDNWHRLCKKYDMKPVIADVFLNSNMFKNRELTKKECINLLIDEIKLADRLGVRLIRLVSMVPAFVIEPLLPYCEKYDVKIALEIHAGMSFNTPSTSEFITEMKRVNSPYVGIVVDTGIFCRRMPRVMTNYCLELGVNPKIIEYVDRLFDEGKDGRAYRTATGGLQPDFAPLIVNQHEHMFAAIGDGYENEPYTILDDIMEYVFHFHFKLFEMTVDGEYSIDYKGLLDYLHSKNYDGYVSTEYEGNRWTLDGQPMQEKEQVLAHQKFIREYLKEIQG